jgi:hypothetical protein
VVLPEGFGCGLDSVEDARVSPAATDVALQGLFDFGTTGIGVVLKESDAAHDHARGAVGTLKSFGVEKGLLNGMEVARLLEAFDGGDGFSRRCGNRSNAGAPSGTVEENGAGTTLTFAAAVFGAGEANAVANDGQERSIGVEYNGITVTIDVEIETWRHRIKKRKKRS